MKENTTRLVILFLLLVGAVAAAILLSNVGKTSYALEDGFKRTEELTEEDKTSESQKNYQESADGLIKGVEWTDKKGGKAQITLQYKIPEDEIYIPEAHAAYFIGGCMAHEYTKEKAIFQINELLEHYDTVDVYATDKGAVDPSSGDVVTSNHKPWNTTFKKGDTVTLPDDVFKPDGYHYSGGYLLSYLDQYLQNHDPDLIVIAADGSYAGRMTDWHDNYSENAIIKDMSKYFTTKNITLEIYSATEEITGFTDAGKALARKLAKYQNASPSQYVITMPTGSDYTSFVPKYGNGGVNDTNWVSALLYAPVAVTNNSINPESANELIQNYLPAGQRVYSYGESLAYQDFEYVAPTHELSLTDTINAAFVIDEANISVTPNGTVKVDGQTVTVNFSSLEGGQEVKVVIPMTLKEASFKGADDSFADVNDGPATFNKDGTKLTVISPKLYKKSGGKVVVKYVDESGKEIAKKVEYSGEVGEKYTSKAKDITGYELKDKPKEETVTLIDGTIELIYVYKKPVVQVPDTASVVSIVGLSIGVLLILVAGWFITNGIKKQ